MWLLTNKKLHLWHFLAKSSPLEAPKTTFWRLENSLCGSLLKKLHLWHFLAKPSPLEAPKTTFWRLENSLCGSLLKKLHLWHFLAKSRGNPLDEHLEGHKRRKVLRPPPNPWGEGGTVISDLVTIYIYIYLNFMRFPCVWIRPGRCFHFCIHRSNVLEPSIVDLSDLPANQTNSAVNRGKCFEKERQSALSDKWSSLC